MFRQKILIITAKLANFGHLCKQEHGTVSGGEEYFIPVVGGGGEEGARESLFPPRFSRIRAGREIGARDLR